MTPGFFPLSRSIPGTFTPRVWAHLALCLLLFSFSPTARTQPPGADSLGTLFTTPYEREYMDRLRNEYLLEQARDSFDIEEQTPPPMIDETEEVVEEAPATLRFHLGGIMERNDGTRILWLNGTQVAEDDLPDNVSLVPDNGNQALRIRTEAQTYLLRVGQVINLVSGELLEAYEVAPAPEDSNSADLPEQPQSATPPAPTAPVNTGQDADTIIAQLIEALQQLQETPDEE